MMPFGALVVAALVVGEAEASPPRPEEEADDGMLASSCTTCSGSHTTKGNESEEGREME